MATRRAQEVETHDAGLGALGADAMTDRLFGILRHQGFQLSFGSLVFQKFAAWFEINSQTPPRNWTRSCQRSNCSVEGASAAPLRSTTTAA